MEKRGLAGRFRWLLEMMMRLQGIDVQELDASLDYWEAKAEVEAKYRTKLVLRLGKLEEKMLEEPSRKYVHCEIPANIMERKATEERGWKRKRP